MILLDSSGWIEILRDAARAWAFRGRVGEEMVLVAIQGFVVDCCSSYVVFTNIDREGDVLRAYLKTSWEHGMLMAITNPYHIIAVESASIVIFYGEHANDVVPPAGSIVINGGDPTTESREVTLALAYSDVGSGVSKVRYSNDGLWDDEPWESPSPTRAWTVTPWEGKKTVYYQIIDNVGLLSPKYFDDIYLNDQGPYVTRYEGAESVECTNCTRLIAVRLNERMNPSSTNDSIPVTADGAMVDIVVNWSQDRNVVTFAPCQRSSVRHNLPCCDGSVSEESGGKELGMPSGLPFHDAVALGWRQPRVFSG